MKRLAWILIPLLLTGCVHMKNLRVLASKEPIKEQLFTINDGDTLVCDPRGCRTLN